MHKFTLFIALALINVNFILAQCPQGNVTFYKQTDIDSFVLQYPDCTIIKGDLKIGVFDQPNNSINDLTGLNQIVAVEGDLNINSNAALSNLNGLENIKTIGEDLTISTNAILSSIEVFENIVIIENRLAIGLNPVLTNLTGLHNIDKVGSLNISYSDALENLSGLENIRVIEGTLNISNNPILKVLSGLDNISSVGGLLIADNPALLNLSVFQNITSLKRYLQIKSNVALSDLSGISNISTIGEQLVIVNIPSLTDLSDFANIRLTGGALSISNNQNLTSLSGIENIGPEIQSLGIAYNPNLFSLSELSNISLINGFINVVDNDALVNLDGLQHITALNDGLRISGNKALTDISALKNLKAINGYLSVAQNESLTSLAGIENIVNGIDELLITYNLQINNCGFENICSFIEANSNPSLARISNNAEGCNSKEEIVATCGNAAKVVSRFFYDVNQNKLQEGDEPFLTFGILKVLPGNFRVIQNPTTGLGVRYVFPGNYTYSVDKASITNWSLTTEANYNINLTEEECKTVSFGLHPNELISDMQATIHSNFTRCFDTITFFINAKNFGTTITEGVVWLNADTLINSVNYIDEPDTIILPNKYGWFFGSLLPDYSTTKQIKLVIPGPPYFAIDDSLTFKSTIEFEDQKGKHNADTTVYKTRIRCSYDPNDKLVNPQRFCDYVLFDENITYTIRFQNTGNDVAFKVIIDDEIDSNLDLSTFNLISSSHIDSLETILTDDGLVTFEFRNINLPDSATNLEGSQGYVTYTIKAKTGLPENTIIKNSSAIYFDYNPPIITNTVQSILVSELPNTTWCRDMNNNGLGDPHQSLQSCEQPQGYVMDCTDTDDLLSIYDNNISEDINIYPNPTNGNFKIDFGDVHFSEAWVSLYNVSDQQIVKRSKLTYNQQWLAYPNLNNGIYYLNIELDDMVLKKKLLVIR